VIPEPHYDYHAETTNIEQAVAASWQTPATDVPMAVKIDNTHNVMQDMLDLVAAFGVAAVDYAEQHEI
jgi:hypothetical protein